MSSVSPSSATRISKSEALVGLRCAIELARQRVSFVTVQNGGCGLASHVGVVRTAGPDPSLSVDTSKAFRVAANVGLRSEIDGPGSLLATLVEAERRLSSVVTRAWPERAIGRRFARADAGELVAGVLDDRDLHAFERIIERGGATRYVVDPKPSRWDSVETIDVHRFKHVSKRAQGRIELSGARVLVADGYVENVSEIHALLDRCSREGEKLLLCSRGFSDDVLHTLAVNRGRGTLDAHAVAFPFDEVGANTLVDLAVVLGGDVVSSLKGQLYSTVVLESLPRVKNAVLVDDTLELTSLAHPASLAQHVSNVKEKLEAVDPTLRYVYESRLRTLTGSSLIVRLASGVDHSLRHAKWDLAMRILTAAVRGVAAVDPNDWHGRALAPIASISASVVHARQLVITLEQLSG